MPKIDEVMDQHSGRGLSSESGVPTLKDLLIATQSDLAELRAQYIALLQKLDADAGDTGGDNDYESVLTPAALNLTQ